VLFGQLTFLLCAFLLAAVPFGLVLTALLSDVDIRSAGSGNIGATNVYRLAGRTMGALTLAGDVLKGLIPALLAHWVFDGPWGQSLTILLVFLGHCYTPYLEGRGGKGVAVAIGAFLATTPIAAVAATGVWITTVVVTRKSSAGALAGLLALIAVLAVLPGARPYLPIGLVVGALMIWRHRDNIRRLISGEEGKV
jgi:acyl phosphate:glycerol-3-phosphate acyltransferase